MKQREAQISKDFKKTTLKAVISIGFFIFIHLLLITFALCLTIFAGWAGITLISLNPNIYSLGIGAGLVSMGVLVFIFLIKFMFKKHSINRSNLIEIKETDEPQLFAFIRQIVNKVKTDFPKKVYISPEVNAYVFYESNFRSMFFPVKKNIQIGIGLINSLTVNEFEAILAHEFGHFSQKTMKIGSYVYNVNRVIYNLLYDNESFESLLKGWAKVHVFITLFIILAGKIVEGIKWILKKVYTIVNITYMGLSREMEFHADEIAANVAGSDSLISSLLRLELSDYSYNSVLDYYNQRIADSVKTKNIFPQHEFVMKLLAKESKLTIENNLPQVTIDHLSKYNKSKLTIKDQWASHPGTPERIANLYKLAREVKAKDCNPASTLFSNIDKLGCEITEKLFSEITYNGQETCIESEEFIKNYTIEYKKNSFNKIYNGYYNSKNPCRIDIEKIPESMSIPGDSDISSSFNDNMIDTVYTSNALENDLNILKQISDGEYKIKTFDYDGKKYSFRECKNLLKILEKESNKIKDKLKENDIRIYNYFYSLAKEKGKEEELKQVYQSFFSLDNGYDKKIQCYINMLNNTSFIRFKTSFSIIEENLKKLNDMEHEFKKQIEEILSEEIYQCEIKPEIREDFNKYLADKREYFNRPKYNNDALALMFKNIQNFQTVISQTYRNLKRNLLEYQAELEKNKNTLN